MKTIVIINKVRSLYNVGAIFRTADAVDIEKIVLTGYSGIIKEGSEVKLHPKLQKTALKGIDVSWEHTNNPSDYIAKLKEKGYKIIALEQTEKSTNYTSYDYNQPIAIIVGHEIDGVEDELVDQADAHVSIPMKGKSKSLNVAIATSILLYEIERQNEV